MWPSTTTNHYHLDDDADVATTPTTNDDNVRPSPPTRMIWEVWKAAGDLLFYGSPVGKT